MLKKKSTLILVLVLSIITIMPSNAQQDPPGADCCFQIWATGCWLGWAGGLSWNTRDWRHGWATADSTLVNYIDNASNTITAAYRACSNMNRAWDDAGAKASTLFQKREQYRLRPTLSNRRGLYSYLNATQYWGDQLRRQVYINRSGRRETYLDTCGEKYYELGYNISRATEHYRHAIQIFSAGGNNWMPNLSEGKMWLRKAREVVIEYGRVVSGRCVDLSDLDLKNRIFTILNRGVTGRGLNRNLNDIEGIRKNISDRLQNNCFTGSGHESECRRINKWNGGWMVIWEGGVIRSGVRMKLIQRSASGIISGSFEWKGGRIHSARAFGNVLEGEWEQPDDPSGGTFKFIISKDCKSFKGHWWDRSNRNNGVWNGKKQ